MQRLSKRIRAIFAPRGNRPKRLYIGDIDARTRADIGLLPETGQCGWIAMVEDPRVEAGRAALRARRDRLIISGPWHGQRGPGLGGGEGTRAWECDR